MTPSKQKATTSSLKSTAPGTVLSSPSSTPPTPRETDRKASGGRNRHPRRCRCNRSRRGREDHSPV
jgi:hypothetical protein